MSTGTSLYPERTNRGDSHLKTWMKRALPFRLRGRVNAARDRVRTVTLVAHLMRLLSNWREVWIAHKLGTTFPELRLRCGLVLTHGKGDQPLFSFEETFREQPYTREHFYRPNRSDTVIDIGANIGIFAIYLQYRARGIAVHCFEPAVASRNRLQSNVSINGLGSCVSIYPYAVFDKNAVLHLKQHVHTVERSLVRDEKDIPGAEPVESVTLARALELSGVKHVDLLKIDIEGAELEVILGSGHEEWKGIKRVALEYHGNLRPNCLETLTLALRERGYSYIRAIPSSSHITSQGILHARR